MSREIEVHRLTERQAEIVQATIETGKLKWACKKTGYDYRGAQRLFSENAGFQQAIIEALRIAQVEDAIMARKVLRDTLEKSKDDAVKVRAAKDILDRGIGKAPDRVTHNHKHSLNRDELVEKIGSLASELGISPEGLLAQKVVASQPAEDPPQEQPKPGEEPSSEPVPQERPDEPPPTLPRLK